MILETDEYDHYSCVCTLQTSHLVPDSSVTLIAANGSHHGFCRATFLALHVHHEDVNNPEPGVHTQTWEDAD